MSLNTTPRTWVAGEVVTAAFMNTEIRDAVTGMEAAWTAYTPTATNFTIGNGTLTARYGQVGRSFLLRTVFVAGTTSAYTASAASISLPVGAHATGSQSLHLRLSSTAGQFAGSGDITAGGTVFTMAVPTSTANCGLVSMSSATPNPGTVGFVVVEGSYEAV